MNTDIFESVKSALGSRLAEVTETLLPGGKIVGREYICASLAGGQGKSCRINLENGVGSDFATGETCSDIIDLAAKIWNVRPYEAASELARQYGIMDKSSFSDPAYDHKTKNEFTPIIPVPSSAPEPMRCHPNYGTCARLWRYLGLSGELLFCTARFDTQSGKVVLPQVYGSVAKAYQKWVWKALVDNRPLYGLNTLQTMPNAPVLLVEGEKTADAAQNILSEYAVLSWSGGCKAVRKSDFSPLKNRIIIIWPDNDRPGFDAALDLCEALENLAPNVKVVLPDESLPEAWDLADEPPADFNIQKCLREALTPAIFRQKATGGNNKLSLPQTQEAEE